MKKLVPAEVLKVFRTIVLALELKINSLWDVIRGMEIKIEELTAAQSAMREGKPKIIVRWFARCGSGHPVSK